jgi:hypothetical protein
MFMWLKLSTQWVNMANLVRVEIVEDGPTKVVTLVSVKPGGSDRTIVQGSDVAIIEEWLQNNKLEAKTIKKK